MAYFEDLTVYTYSGDMEFLSLDRGEVRVDPWYTRLNVGWLDAAHDIPRGPVPPEFLGNLLEIIAGPRTNVMRGYHPCPFCAQSDNLEHHGQRLDLGTGEIRVPEGSTVVFAAPTLVWHYVDAHGYRPPDRFIAAVESYDGSWITRCADAHAQRITVPPLNPGHVPEAVRPLIPLARRWGIGDDEYREEAVWAADPAQLEELLRALTGPAGNAMYDWLAGPATEAPTTKEHAAFTAMSKAADTARTLQEQRRRRPVNPHRPQI